MQKLPLLVLFMVFTVGLCCSQSLNDPFSQGTSSQGTSQGTSSQGTSVDCSDPRIANSPLCSSAQQQRSGSVQGIGGSSLPMSTPSLTTPYGFSPDQYTPTRPPLNPPQIWHRPVPVRPETEFEQMVADSVGRPLPLFGQSLFVQAPSTFSPVDFMQVPSDYIIGPGDELQIRVWGQIEASLRVIVDRSGQIYIPQVGQISVAGIHYGNLYPHLKSEISKIFKNFNITANIGRLRSIQVVVVGNARFPGTYTISSLSTLVNAIFASGGPVPQGSLRHIQVRRDGVTITDFDFYDLLIKGDKSKDVRLQPGDVLYIPHVGPFVAISGSVNTPAIYEMKDTSTLSDLIEVAGDLSTVADTSKVLIDRFVEHQSRKTLEFPYDDQSRALLLKDGDIVRVFSIVPRFEDTVTLRGNVANPGRYPWKPGMRVRDLIPDAQALLTRRYWRNRAAIVTGRGTEYPLRSEGSESAGTPANQQQTNGTQTSATGTPDFLNSNGESASVEYVPNATGSANAANPAYAQNGQNTAASDTTRTTTRNTQSPTASATQYSNLNVIRDVAEEVRRYAPEINWDYAIIQRVNPEDLSSKLIWMSPRKAIIERDDASNLELRAGDIVTIFSQRDISVPQAERSQYVILEGEVMRPGVYKLEDGETLRAVLQRAGGLTPDAYIYGTQFTRESARIDQQKSLDELATAMEVQIRQSAVAAAASP